MPNIISKINQNKAQEVISINNSNAQIKQCSAQEAMHIEIGERRAKDAMFQNDDWYKALEQSYENMIKSTGDDATRSGLVATPKRAAKAFGYMTQGYHQNLDEIINGAIFETDNNEMVIIKDIEFYSLCEHHILPFFGKCHVGYLPNGKVLGLSKIPRIVDYFSRRLQIQENLTKQIADCIQEVTNGLGVAVVMNAQHMCTMMRGVNKQSPSMTTRMMLGKFKEGETRAEFLKLLNLSSG